MTTQDLLITRISDQIREEQDYTKILEKGGLRLARTKYWVPVPVLLFLIWAVVCITNGISALTILMLWIVGSFFIYMFYFFLMMIPSLGSDSSSHLTSTHTQIQIREFLRLANLLKTVRKNKVTFIEIFWNAFLINAKPLAKGFAIIYLIDMVCAVILYAEEMIDLHLLIIVCFQILLIFVFYAKIVRSKPDTPGFFVPRNQETVSPETETAKIKIWLYISLFAMITGLLVVGAMLFPGITLNNYLSVISILPSEYPMILILVLLVQAVIIRYFQGIESRTLMETLNASHIAALKDDLLPRVKTAGPEQLNDLQREFLILRMNKLMVQEFFHRFPVYAIVPNFLLIADPEAQEVLDSTGDEKSIKDLL
ncbi:MAG TPA: hypothetical protein O0X03_00540 [Methanocorpusculum sp.]|nr:hypothetical protein [Methanocorpusculum sp.]HJK76090.1 hypothetical protein [Methanocorpusculum sp.]